MTRPFADHFSARAQHYAEARPEYPQALFDWLAKVAPGNALAWEAGCGSGQATRGLAQVFTRVHATDASAAQFEQAHGPVNIDFRVAPSDRCELATASVDLACVAQALHWFDRPAYFAEVVRVLKPGGVLVAWGYQDVEVPAALVADNARLQAEIREYWPSERADVDAAYAHYQWPLPRIDAPVMDLIAAWPLQRLLNYYASYSATQRHAASTGRDIVDELAPAFSSSWGSDAEVQLHWPLFIHAFRKPH